MPNPNPETLLLLGACFGLAMLLLVLVAVWAIDPGPRMPGGDYSWFERRRMKKERKRSAKMSLGANLLCASGCSSANPFHVHNFG